MTTASLEQIEEYALAEGLSLKQAAKSLRLQAMLRNVQKATTVDELKPILKLLLLETL